MRKNILVVAQDFPYPLDYAGPIDTFNKIRALHANGFNVYLIATVKEKVTDESIKVMNEYCVQTQLIYRKYNITNFFSLLPFQMKSRIDENEIQRIRLLFVDIKFDSVICDGYYAIETVRKIISRYMVDNVYLRVNNNEIKYFIGLAKSSRNILKKIYYISDAMKFYIHERFILPTIKLNGFLHVSYDEKKCYEVKFPKFKHFFLPAAIDITMMNTYFKRDRRKVLFVGSLFMPNNVEGLKWYINNIHDDLIRRYSDYELIVAGNVRGIDCEPLDKYLSAKANITFVKSPQDLSVLYNESMIFINPMLNGAGVKLKTLNALCSGLPVVSTTVGNEGTGLVDGMHILVGSEKISFCESMVLLMENEEMRKDIVVNGQVFLSIAYNQSAALQKILE